MTGADATLNTVSKYIDIGLPLLILAFIAWWVAKYSPNLVKAANNLGESMKANTSATCALKDVFDVQGDQLMNVTVKLQGAVDTLARCEAKQVKMEDFNKLFILVSTMQNKLNELHTEMTAHAKKHEEDL